MMSQYVAVSHSTNIQRSMTLADALLKAFTGLSDLCVELRKRATLIGSAPPSSGGGDQASAASVHRSREVNIPLAQVRFQVGQCDINQNESV